MHRTDTVKIVSALPLTGPSYGTAISIVHAIRLAVEEAGRVAGPFFVEYEAWDDASAAVGDTDSERVAELAQRAVEDPDVLVYIGHLTSEATRRALPILNGQGLVTIGPSSSASGLTKRAGAAPGEPDVYYPAGIRTYARVIPSDETHGAAAAGWAKTLGATVAYVFDDRQPSGVATAYAFAAACARNAIRIAGRAALDPNAATFRTQSEAVRTAGADVVFIGATAVGRVAQLLRDLRAAGYTRHVIGPDALRTLVGGADVSVEGMWATSVGVPPSVYTGHLLEWKQRFSALSGSEPEPLALYGYDAARVALAAIERAAARDRNAVREQVFATRDFPGLLGPWSFDASGDTTDTTVVVNRASRVAGGLDWIPYDLVTAP